jgi:iron complex outermembrane recepter protein
MRITRLVCTLSFTIAMALMALPAFAQSSDPVWSRPIEELMQVEVISVGKKEQTIHDSAAAVYVLTSEEIRRSGLTTVPDLLRLVPGVTVSQIDASKWAVSVRGFNSRFANKLLVMIDGRSLYSRMFSGVFWDAIGVPVEEIERIEVVRGPGASLWGANAVNGVINIVTRAAGSTPGTSLVAGGGHGDRWSAGGAHSRSTPVGTIRAFGYASDREGGGGFDDWRQAQAGLRFQRGATGRAHFTFDVNGTRSEAGQRSLLFQSLEAEGLRPFDTDAVTNAFSTVARAVRPLRAGGELQLIGTYEQMSRREASFFSYERHISDIGVQHRVGGLGRHDLIWGAGARYLTDEVVSEGPTLAIQDPTFSETLVNAFVQDEIRLRRGLTLTAGAKVEHTPVTGWQAQPTVRVWWTPEGETAIWGAVSRALRTPSRADEEVTFNASSSMDTAPLPVLVQFTGNPAIKPEHLTAYEAGVRRSIGDRVAVDLSGFYNRYDGLMMNQLHAPRFAMSGLGPHLLVAMVPENVLDADTIGAETVAVATLTPTWHITGTMTVFKMTDWRSQAATIDTSFVDGETPRVQWSLRSNLSWKHFEFDGSLFRSSALSMPRIEGYVRVDARVSRRLRDGLEIALAGQNLFRSHHIESGDGVLVAVSEVPRSVALRATWRFGK